MLEKDEERRDWHLDKGVSIGHLTSTATVFVMIVLAWATMSERMAIVENQQHALNNRMIEMLSRQDTVDSKQDVDRAETRRLMREDYREISLKLDAINVVLRTRQTN